LSLVIGRSGQIRNVILLPLLTIAYVVLHLAARNRGIHSGGLVIIPVLIMVGSRVLDRWPLIAFAAFLNVAVFAMVAFQHLVTRAEPFTISELGDLFLFVATCVTATVAGRIFAAHIEEGFRQVRESECRSGRRGNRACECLPPGGGQL
jgi:hypothetical protein